MTAKDIYLHQNGETVGPYSTGDILTMYETGQVAPGASCATEGQSEWVPIGDFVAPLRKKAVKAQTIRLESCRGCGKNIGKGAWFCVHCGQWRYASPGLFAFVFKCVFYAAISGALLAALVVVILAALGVSVRNL